MENPFSRYQVVATERMKADRSAVKGFVLVIENSQRLSKHPVQQQKPHVKNQAINDATTSDNPTRNA
jgi:hypothetical protein